MIFCVLFFGSLKLYVCCVYVCCVYVCCVYVGWMGEWMGGWNVNEQSQRPEDSIKSPGTRATDGCAESSGEAASALNRQAVSLGPGNIIITQCDFMCDFCSPKGYFGLSLQLATTQRSPALVHAVLWKEVVVMLPRLRARVSIYIRGFWVGNDHLDLSVASHYYH